MLKELGLPLPSALLLAVGLSLSLAACDSDADEGGEDEAADTDPNTESGESTTGGCPTGLTDCEGECVDLNTDPLNCGSCGFDCGPGGTCDAALCTAACDAPEISCHGVCIDPTNNDEHCGGCDETCVPGLSCADSVCQCGDPVSFTADALPLLSDGCTMNGNNSCHSGAEPSAGLDLSGDVHAALVDAPSNQCNSGVLVSAGSVDGSYLINKLLGDDMCQGQRMPRNSDAYTPDQIATVANWICHGAAND